MAGEDVAARPDLCELPFARLVALLAELERVGATRASLSARQATCRAFWAKLTREYKFTLSGLHALLRLALPHFEHGRVYGAKEQTLARWIVTWNGWRRDALSGASLNSGALEARVREVVRQRRAAGSVSSLTVGGVNSCLEQLGEGRPEAAVSGLFSTSHATGDEAFWLVRIILKKALLHSAVARELVNALSPGAWDERCVDLRALCERLCRPSEEAVTLGVFHRTAQPRAARAPVDAWAKLWRTAGFDGSALVETKVDGWRLQLHLAPSAGADWVSRVFTHSGRARSQPLGEHARFFADVLARLRAALGPEPQPGGAILDCEVLIFDDARERFEPFGGVGAQPKGTRHHCLVLFDALMLRGTPLVAEPLWRRRRELEAAISPQRGWVELSRAEVVRWAQPSAVAQSASESTPPRRRAGAARTPSESESPSCAAAPPPPPECPIRAAMARAIAASEEGLVVKALCAPYAPSPAACGWLKLKSCYIHGVHDEMSLVVLGYERGKDERGGWLLGALSGSAGGGALRFVRVCRASLALGSTEDRQALLDRFRSLEKVQPASASELPAWCAGAGDAADAARAWARGDVRLLRHAREGIVVDLLASELLPARAPPGGGGGRVEHAFGGDAALGFCLRFPRIVRLKLALEPGEAHTCAQLNELFLAERERQDRACAVRAGDLDARSSGALGDERELRARLAEADRALAASLNLRMYATSVAPPLLPSPHAPAESSPSAGAGQDSHANAAHGARPAAEHARQADARRSAGRAERKRARDEVGGGEPAHDLSARDAGQPAPNCHPLHSWGLPPTEELQRGRWLAGVGRWFAHAGAEDALLARRWAECFVLLDRRTLTKGTRQRLGEALARLGAAHTELDLVQLRAAQPVRMPTHVLTAWHAHPERRECLWKQAQETVWMAHGWALPDTDARVAVRVRLSGAPARLRQCLWFDRAVLDPFPAVLRQLTDAGNAASDLGADDGGMASEAAWRQHCARQYVFSFAQLGEAYMPPTPRPRLMKAGTGNYEDSVARAAGQSAADDDHDDD